MKNPLKYSFTWLAAILLLLHSFVPHHHDDAHGQVMPTFKSETSSYTSFWQLAKIGLSQDVGVDHLDHFKASEDGKTFDILIVGSVDDISNRIPLQQHQILFSPSHIVQDIPISSPPFLTKVSFRGPPFV